MSEILILEVLNPCLQGEEIVYSPNKYRETEGIKGLWYRLKQTETQWSCCA